MRDEGGVCAECMTLVDECECPCKNWDQIDDCKYCSAKLREHEARIRAKERDELREHLMAEVSAPFYAWEGEWDRGYRAGLRASLDLLSPSWGERKEDE
jgi:hypothetical protein